MWQILTLKINSYFLFYSKHSDRFSRTCTKKKRFFKLKNNRMSSWKKLLERMRKLRRNYIYIVVNFIIIAARWWYSVDYNLKTKNQFLSNNTAHRWKKILDIKWCFWLSPFSFMVDLSKNRRNWVKLTGRSVFLTTKWNGDGFYTRLLINEITIRYAFFLLNFIIKRKIQNSKQCRSSNRRQYIVSVL